MMTPIRGLFAASSLFASSLALSSVALAHAVLEPALAAPDQPWNGALVVGHGCDGAPTTALRLTLPDGVPDAVVAPLAGWTVRREGRDIVWSGGTLPPKERGSFPFTVTWSNGKIGEPLYVSVVQTCTNGDVAWKAMPAAGQSAHDLKDPAARIDVVAAGDLPKTYTLGALRIEQPWSRATPKGAPVAGGYLKVTNTGTAPDQLLGATFGKADKGEVHEMSMDGGVMRMKRVDGVEIPAGGSVELKPGGYHLMFMGLKDQLAEGDRVTGRLVFEKAGALDVDFQVRAMNAGAGGMTHAH